MSHEGFQRPARLVRAGLSVAVTEAATVWWLSKRPDGWTLKQHLANPGVNCTGEPETHLAAAVAGMIAGTQETIDRIRGYTSRENRRTQQHHDGPHPR